MRFNLEPGDTACDSRSKLVAVKINNEERINLPFTSYVFDKDHFVISNFRRNPMNSILTNLSQGLQLKLEKAGDDYNLALVNDSGQYYYFYYHDPNTVKIATFDSIPSNFIEYRRHEYIYSYTNKCSINLVPLIKSKVLIDPKDIMSSEDINLILKELESSPDKRLRISAGENFLISHNYKSVKIYNPSNNSIGILNNIAASFNNEKLLLSSRNATVVTDEFGTNLKRTNLRFRIKRLNNDNYVGCILSEYGKCERFYALTPESFEQDEHLLLDDYEDDSPSYSSHPYYYYLHGLEVSMNHKKIKDLEKKIENLQLRMESVVAMPGPPGPRGLPGQRGELGPRGLDGLPGIPGEKGEKGQEGGFYAVSELTGKPGPKGDQGHPGPNGLPGEKGDKGDQGYLGYGYPSQKGEPGAPGLPGLDGMPGGPKGEKGEAGGPQGPKGEKGMPGLSITSPKGDRGESGLKGSSGAKGDQGPKGKQGDLGLKGPQGPSGAKGEKGNEGSSGPKGLRGWKGESGLQGKEGAQGKAGKDGLPGMPGSKGDQGNAGPRGPQGNKGDQGLVGPQGFKGDKGEQGIQGPRGFKGDKGEQGIQGPRGFKGDKGEQGIQGPRGFKGLSGSRGAKGEQGHSGMDANPEEVADKLVTTRATGFKEMMLNFTDSSGKMLMEELAGSSSLHTGVAQKLIDNETIANKVLEYRDKGGNLLLEQQIIGRLYDANIHEGIANKLIDNRAQELADALLSSADNDTLVEKLANSTELIKSISEELKQNPGKVQGPKGDKGADGAPGIPGEKGDQGDIGPKGDMGDKGDTGAPGTDGLKGDKGVDGLPGMPGIKGEPGLRGFNGTQGLPGAKGEPGIDGLKGDTGSVGPIGIDGTPGSKGEKGDLGPKVPKGKDGVGAAVADQFLSEINKAKIEIQNAKKAAEDAKSASEIFAKEAEGFKEEADNFADKAFQSEKNTQALHNQIKDIFCKTRPTDQVCTVRRKKREIEKLNNPPVTSGASRPTSFISQVINFFYPSVKQDEYKIENKIQELNQVAKIIDAADIVMRFEKVLEETASKCGIPKKSLNFDPVKLQSTILDRSLFNDESRNELLKLLYLSAKKSCPNYKQTDRFLATFKDRMERTLENNEQQRGFVNIEKTATDNEQPRSFMSDVTPPSSFKAIDLKAVNCLR